MTKVVISQPMYFPWYGHLEQIKHCDIYVFYDDVQFSRGFFNRVQLKAGDSQRWMTVPLEGGESRKPINQHQPSGSEDWISSHKNLFRQLYEEHPFYANAMNLLEATLHSHNSQDSLARLSEHSTRALAKTFELNHTCFMRSSDLNIGGKGSQRLVDICKHLGATEYITGHGASKYMDHSLFEESGISVSYISYGKSPYPQHSGHTFIPYVSSLDCIANCGHNSYNYLSGSLVSWKEFLGKPHP